MACRRCRPTLRPLRRGAPNFETRLGYAGRVWGSPYLDAMPFEEEAKPMTCDTGPPEFALTLERLLDAPVAEVWQCWTDPALLEQWFCPKPWYVTDARIELRPGGEFSSVMHGPDGEEVEATGVVLEAVPGKRLITTDAFRPGWIPSGRAFMVTEILLEATAAGRTRYTARVRHWDEAARAEHEAMGFQEGWGQAADQLEALARSL